MEIGQAIDYTILAASLIGAVGVILASLKKLLNSIIKPLNDKLDTYEFESKKTDLINYMCLAEKMDLTEEQRINAHELYDYYVSHNGNSYVHDKWEKLVEKGLI